MISPKNTNEVCYGNIFYFWRLETRLFSRHFFLDFGLRLNVHFIFVNLLWERGQGCVVQTYVVQTVSFIIPNSFCLGLNQWIFVYSVLLGLHKWKLGEYLLIYIFKITLDFGLSDKASLMRSARSGWIFNAKPSIHESWIHLLF